MPKYNAKGSVLARVYFDLDMDLLPEEEFEAEKIAIDRIEIELDNFYGSDGATQIIEHGVICEKVEE